ncbi:MAG TPA: hypothetical protein VFW50_16980 [Streptosporangiaceae bacterium]|nr:hypothetical protein [Streptosporangiaceae bacterium]
MTATEGSAAAASSGNNNAAAISVRGLRMSYGTYKAVRGIDSDVEAGEIPARPSGC